MTLPQVVIHGEGGIGIVEKDFAVHVRFFILTFTHEENESGNHVKNLMHRVARMFRKMKAQGGGDRSLINGLVKQMNHLLDQTTSWNNQ